jgi:hypothetical protein
MFARLRLAGLVLLLSAAAIAQRAMTTNEVVTFIQNQIKSHGDDRQTADYLKKIKLSDRLDERTIENLQGDGAGPRTVEALKHLATESAALPAPPPPVAVAPPPPPPPPPSAKEQAEVIEAMREYARNYTASLPNYVCVQTTHRKLAPSEMMHSRGYISNGDVIQELLTFFDKKETYKVEMINGASVTNVDHMHLGGVVSSGEFGSMMHNIFDPEAGAQFAWENWHTVRGKRMYAFSYHIDKEHGYSMADEASHREYTSAYKGLVYADLDTKAIMVITLDTIEIPADFPVKEVHIRLDYDQIKVGEELFMLPYHYLLTSRTDQGNSSNEADYRLYRKYGAESSITFGDTTPVSPDTLKDEPDKK